MKATHLRTKYEKYSSKEVGSPEFACLAIYESKS